MEKKKVIRIDFGDTPVILTSIEEALAWIKTDLETLLHDDGMIKADELNYQITTREMTKEEIEALPDWA